MNTMLERVSNFLQEKNIYFNPQNQRVRCLAHIINLAAKQAIENLYVSYSDVDDNILDEIDDNIELLSIIKKVLNKSFSLIKLNNFIIKIYFIK